MKPRHVIQLILGVTLVAAVLRLGLIYYERHAAAPDSALQTALDPDYYVVPKKLHAYDLNTARAGMVGHPAWVREGYKFTYYRYDPGRHHTDFAHPAGLLLPLQQLDVRDVVLTPAPAAGELPQIVAVFSTGGQDFAVPIGARQGEDYTLYADDMLFFEDPHQLYRHWAPEVWQAVDRHQVLPGMNEIQVWFALGMGIPQPAGDQPGKTVVYPNGGKPTTVVFRAGRAVEIQP
ncbi:MAG TPA: hypothetical protein VES66_08530 [Terriglobales bacterium]|nr:hypothetical protein [Terriglobales bacterium]